MTKAQIAAFVTSKLCKTDAASVAACKGFIDFRYQMIWDNMLWKKSLALPAVMTVPAGTTDVTLDDSIALPVAVRWDKVTLDSTALETVFRVDPTAFDRTGNPVGFAIRPNVAGRAVIRLLVTPDQDKTLLVLGKAVFVPLADGDSPLLDAVDQCLTCYVEGDMQERNSQGDKAQTKFTEANQHLAVMKSQETDQMADEQQIVPACEPGYYNQEY